LGLLRAKYERNLVLFKRNTGQGQVLLLFLSLPVRLRIPALRGLSQKQRTLTDQKFVFARFSETKRTKRSALGELTNPTSLNTEFVDITIFVNARQKKAESVLDPPRFEVAAISTHERGFAFRYRNGHYCTRHIWFFAQKTTSK